MEGLGQQRVERVVVPRLDEDCVRELYGEADTEWHTSPEAEFKGEVRVRRSGWIVDGQPAHRAR